MDAFLNQLPPRERRVHPLTSDGPPRQTDGEEKAQS